ncbi:MAG: family 78 glycoside hydrolase catalytic domain [Eubacteriales bacterium]|nr:family 78 glycoside hydrolase catalytic domain [Eubacteriales bacterium]
MAYIYAAKTNHMVNPVGFYMDQVVFSWKVEDSIGTKQTDVRIIVSKDQNFSKIVFDRADPNFDSCGTEIPLDLEPYTRYYWKVIVTSDAEEVIASDVQFFETAKMDDAWIGNWIACRTEADRHPVFSKIIETEKEVVRARLYICGLGLYEAYWTAAGREAEKIGNEYLTPYCNNYNQWIQYQTYDVTEQVRGGGKLSVMLGDGWYKGRFGFGEPQRDCHYGNQRKMIAEVHICYADGSGAVIGSDESWTAAGSNILFSNIYDGEKQDDTVPASVEEAAVLAEKPKGRLMERLSLPVVAHERIKPVKVIHTPKDETVLDLGQEISGIFFLHVHEKKGQTIRLQMGEVLQDGCFYNENLRTARAEFVYTSDGTDKIVRPHFTFYGYRYVKVEGIKNVSCDDFTAVALYSDFESIGELKTGNKLVNQLISNVNWGMKGNFLDVPTDCPQRDERMGWTGDTQVFSATASYVSDSYAFYRKYLFDMYQEQLLAGGMVPEIIPTFGPSKCSSVWGDAACIIPWNVYVFSGDKSILEKQITGMRDWVDYIQKVDGENHNWGSAFHYGDWLALDRPGAADNNVYGATDEAYIADVYYGASAQIVADAAEILGQQEVSEHYRKIAESQWEYVKHEYFTGTGRCAIKTQTGLVLALKYHLSSDEEKIKTTLRKLFRDNKYKLNTGFVGTPLLCNVLTENGMEDIAYQLLLNEEYPGWLHEVKLGATTVWERWNSLDENGHISSTGMNSLNHYSYGAILEWMYRHMAGINITSAGVGGKRIRMQPRVHYQMQYAACTYDSACGKYSSEWTILEGNKLKLSFHIPFGTEAEIVLPYFGEEQVRTNAGNPLLENVMDGVCMVGAGSYEIVYEANEPLKKRYSIDSTMDELLADPYTRAFLQTMMDTEMLPDIAYGMSLREVAKTFAGEIGEEQEQMLNGVMAGF